MFQNINYKSKLRPSFGQVAVFFCMLVVFLLPALSFANEDDNSVAKNAKTFGSIQKMRAEDLTQQLNQMISAYHSAQEGTAKFGFEEKLTALAEERRELLLEIMEIDPASAIKLALPKGLQDGLPTSIQMQLEQQVEIEGKLEVLHQDFEDSGQSRYLYFLRSQSEKKISLHFPAQAPRLLTGSQVKIKGLVLFKTESQESESIDGLMAVDPEQDSVQILNLGNEGTANTSEASVSVLPNTFGAKRTLVLMVNFQDAAHQEPWTIQQAHDLVFGTVSDFYQENSSDRTWLTGEVHGWYTLPINSSNCKSTDVASYAQAAAQNDNVNLSDFDHYIYVFPQTSCFPSGSGTVGGTPSESWINGDWFILKTVAHEFGHNLGLYHSSSLECGNTTLGSDCKTFLYGDTMDIMANKSTGHFNAFQKEQLGWLDPTLGEITEVVSDGNYTLEVYETANGSIAKAIKVLKGIDPDTGEKTWYYLEYRQDIGFDDFLASNANVLDGLVVHMANDSDPGSSLLLDMTPNSLDFGDWNDPALTFGQSFSDPATGVTITSQWGDGSIATVDVSFGSSSCTQANPGINVSPALSEWVSDGTAIEYTISLTNSDNSSCGSSDFDLQANIPSGWTATFAEPLLAVDPGATATTTLTVTSATGESDGIYDIDISAANSTAPSYTDNTLVTYKIGQSSGNQAPIAVDDSDSTLQDTPLILNILFNDSDPENDLLSIVSVSKDATGTITINADGTITYTPKHKYKGEDHFTYTISDGNQIATANVTMTVISSKSGGGGGGSGGGGGKGNGKGGKN